MPSDVHVADGREEIFRGDFPFPLFHLWSRRGDHRNLAHFLVETGF